MKEEICMNGFIDRKALLDDILKHYPQFIARDFLPITSAPTIDAVQVVRCKDCQHFECLEDTETLSDYGKCLESRGELTQAGSMVFFPSEMFCDYGKHRETHEK